MPSRVFVPWPIEGTNPQYLLALNTHVRVTWWYDELVELLLSSKNE